MVKHSHKFMCSYLSAASRICLKIIDCWCVCCAAMPDKCSVYGCFTNFKGHEKGNVFPLHRHCKGNVDLEQRWFRFLNRNDITLQSKYIFICEKHFEEKYIKRNKVSPRLRKELVPIPTIYPPSLQNTLSITSYYMPATSTKIVSFLSKCAKQHLLSATSDIGLFLRRRKIVRIPQKWF